MVSSLENAIPAPRRQFVVLGAIVFRRRLEVETRQQPGLPSNRGQGCQAFGIGGCRHREVPRPALSGGHGGERRSRCENAARRRESRRPSSTDGLLRRMGERVGGSDQGQVSTTDPDNRNARSVLIRPLSRRVHRHPFQGFARITLRPNPLQTRDARLPPPCRPPLRLRGHRKARVRGWQLDPRPNPFKSIVVAPSGAARSSQGRPVPSKVGDPHPGRRGSPASARARTQPSRFGARPSAAHRPPGR